MTAFRATFSDMKLVKTRQVAQLIFEVPIEEFDAAYEVLGGMPVPSKERWFGIAAIGAKKAEPFSAVKRGWRDIKPSQQAGILCDDAIFAAFLKEKYPDEWHEAPDAADCVRLICAVSSRTLLNEGAPRVIWHQLDSEYQAWLAKERVGA